MTFAIQYRDCETVFSPAGKWKEADRELATRQEAERLLALYKCAYGFSKDFSICVEFD